MIARFAFASSLTLLLGLLARAGLSQTVSAATADGQRVVALAVDGRLLRGQLIALTSEGSRPHLRLRQASPNSPSSPTGEGGTVVELPLRDLVALHAEGTAESGNATTLAKLVGSERLRGSIAGGDEAGETFWFDSPSLGRLEIPIDRLALLVFLERATPQGLERLRPDARAPSDECIYRIARRGFDLRFGEIHRFASDGLHFATEGDPTRIPYGDLAGLAIQGGADRPSAAAALLTTRAGDLVGVDQVGFAADRWSFRLEGDRAITIDAVEFGSLCLRHAHFVHLADLADPLGDERSYFAAGDAPLWRWRRDQNVLGEDLRSAGRAFARGIGVHAKSTLAWIAPAGASAFTGLVAIDDSVRDLAVRGHVDVAIAIDGAVVFERKAVTAGEDLVPLGLLAVKAGQRVELRVDFGAGLDLGDRVNWLDVGFVLEG